ncbi:MAG: FAD-dependent oxidoreductase [Deltaproteobacteria bacterium]|nr:FAD-dependent oxidoreductase [Candidatus Zymogenaceae bacterium]
MELVRLFEPITINKLTVKNRIVMPAMGLLFTDDFMFNERYQAYFRERAEGGVGLMIMGPLAIDLVGCAPYMPALFDDRNIPAFQSFIKDVKKKTGVAVGTQLFHMGRYAYSFVTGKKPIAPSPVPSRLTGETPREMTKEDIEIVQEAFVTAAVNAMEAGFEYIEPVGCTGYLISQFLSPFTNLRTDEYGGSLENRMRFGCEVIEKIRKAVGPDFCLGMRIAGHDFMEGGNTNREAALFAAALEKVGLNSVNVTGGWHETRTPQLTSNVPPGAYVYLARGVKEAVSIPVFASNRLGDPELAERTLRSGAADLICWGRPLIADPELPNKLKKGRTDEVVSCISCNQGCFDSIFSGQAVHCVLNPRVGRESELTIEPAKKKKKIFVAGGGPSGMEFAIIAAQRGHTVTLFEKQDELGGQINLATVPPGKGEFNKIVASMKNRMDAYGVTVKTGTPLTKKIISTEKPDLVVVATGAEPITPPIPGIDKSHVVGAWDVLTDRIPDIGDDVVIIGGSATGCETAHYIASQEMMDYETFSFLMYHNAEDPVYAMELLHRTQRRITVVDMVDRLADNVSRTSRWSLMKSLRLSGVDLRPSTIVKEITDAGVVVESDKGTETIPADTVIIAVGAKPVKTLADDLSSADVPVIVIGDASEPRKIADAVREGFCEARTI